MWEQQAERGTPLAITALLWITRTLGRPVARVVLYPVTTYFLMTGSAARRASRDFLSRVLPRPPGWRDVARHFFTFAAVSLDRFLRSEEHTSELQSLMRISYAAFCLKKKKNII